jgi:hypothetical protein
MLGAKAWLLLSGAALVLIGVLIRWWSSRYDLKDAAIDSAGTLARGRRTAENPTALESKLNNIASQPTWTGKATRAAGTAAGHVMAQILGVIALVLMLIGLGLAVAGFLWG